MLGVLGDLSGDQFVSQPREIRGELAEMGDAAHHLVRFSDPEDLGGMRAGDGARDALDTEPQCPVVRALDEVLTNLERRTTVVDAGQAHVEGEALSELCVELIPGSPRSIRRSMRSSGSLSHSSTWRTYSGHGSRRLRMFVITV